MNRDDQATEPDMRARMAREQAESLFPLETWRELEPRVFIAASREPRSNGQRKTLNKELIQARILTAQGSAVYLLPETLSPATQGEKHPDAVVDGEVMEFKTITGTVRQIEEHFLESRKKALVVFFKIDSPLSRDEVVGKLIGILRQRELCGGRVIAYFSETEKLYSWDIDELNKKSRTPREAR